MSTVEEREEQLRRSVIPILGRGGEVVGTGFFVANDLIATCAHVVRKALSDEGQVASMKGGERIEIRPPNAMSDDEEPFLSLLEVEYFRDEDAEDVAFLRLDPKDGDRLRALRGEVQPLALTSSQGRVEAALRGFAFPEVRPAGLVITATVDGPFDDPRAGHRLQLSSTKISPGCSGGPLWDERGRVIGMVVSMIEGHHDTAFMIAAEVLVKACRELTIDSVERRAIAAASPDGTEADANKTLTPEEIEQLRLRALEQLVAILESHEDLQAHLGRAWLEWGTAARGQARDLAAVVLASEVKEFGARFVGCMKAMRETSASLSQVKDLRQMFEIAQPVIVAEYVRRRVLEVGLEAINAKHPDMLEAMHAAMRGGPTRWCGEGRSRRPLGRVELSTVPEDGAIIDESVRTTIRAGLARDPGALEYYGPDDNLEVLADAFNNELGVHRLTGEPHYAAAERLDPGARALLLRLKHLLPDLDVFVSELAIEDSLFQNKVLGPQRLFYQAYDQIIAEHS